MKLIVKYICVWMFLGVEAIALTSLVHAQDNREERWEFIFDGGTADNGRAVQITPDGGYLVIGDTNIRGTENVDVFVVKLTPYGNRLWRCILGGSKEDRARDVQVTADGSYLIVGETTSQGAGNRDAWIIKLNAQCAQEWERTFGGPEEERFSSCIILPDQSIVLAGQTTSKGAGFSDAWILKLDPQGNLLWEMTFGEMKEDRAQVVRQTADGGFIVAGDTISHGKVNRDMWLFKLDAHGKLQWERTFGGHDEEQVRDLQLTQDGGFILVGDTESQGAGKHDAWIIKTDAQGELLWEQTFGGTEDDEASAIQPLPDGGYIVAGATESQGTGKRDAWLLTLDPQGKLIGNHTYGNKRNDGAYAVRLTPDGEILVIGYTETTGAQMSAWVLKLADS